MSDLSIKSTPEGVVTPPRSVASFDHKSAAGAAPNASVGKGSAPDVSNYVTSPKGVVDPKSGVYVLQYRDGATGEVLNQYPSQKAVSAYKRGAENGEVAAPPAATSTAQSGAGQSTPPGAVSTPSGSVESVGAPSPAVGTVGTGGTTSAVGQGSVTPTSTSVDV